MAVSNEALNYKQYGIMQFVEFLEFIGRLAQIKFENSSEMASNPLAWKIDTILDDLCQAFGLTKNDVNIEKRKTQSQMTITETISFSTQITKKLTEFKITEL